MNIKILVATHKPYWMPEDSVYLPIHVGKEGKIDIGYQGDNTGENISKKNPHYCELTALYWAWKNLDADYIGLVHYRRYFTHKEARSVEKKRAQVLSGNEWACILQKTPVVVAGKRKYYIESNRSHYIHAHHAEGLEEMERIIRKQYPDYVISMEKVMNRTWAHMFNMFVMDRKHYDAYCEWMFDILAQIEQNVDISNYSAYEARIYGFVSELMLDIWLEKNQIPYHEQNVSFMEKQNWIKKGGKFIARKMGLCRA
ncbi:DUF4422 domain-containing protein [Selenomonas ruminantium]|uniref:DUF4422 domain-containing protein n=1 Tax=Selenomonas ruminantium TaxID=971 RepID=A0A1H0TXX7_SELRU|nr:DUF4422 domain-containing protein [Selenomonas ruminantium]SDP58773.1 protein of unknown function [Selenomonas ruminantium]